MKPMQSFNKAKDYNWMYKKPKVYSTHFEVNSVTKEKTERVNNREIERELNNPSRRSQLLMEKHKIARSKPSYEDVQKELRKKLEERTIELNRLNLITLAQHHLVENPIFLGNKNYAMDYDDAGYRDLLKTIMEKYCKKPYAWFKEERGFKHWVLYREDLFEISEIDVGGIIFMNGSGITRFLHYKGTGEIEFPINASSHFFMFKNSRFEYTFSSDTSHFYKSNTKYVIDFIGTFSNARFSGVKSFPENYDTSNANKMDGMFYRTEFLGGSGLPKNFNTNGAVSMSYMFFGAFLNSDFKLPETFSTVNVFNMEGMFFDCYLSNCILGKNFNTSKVINMCSMFNGAKTDNKNFKLPETFSTESLIYSKHMFYAGALGIQFYTRDKTNKNIVQILKKWGTTGEPLGLF